MAAAARNGLANEHVGHDHARRDVGMLSSARSRAGWLLRGDRVGDHCRAESLACSVRRSGRVAEVREILGLHPIWMGPPRAAGSGEPPAIRRHCHNIDSNRRLMSSDLHAATRRRARRDARREVIRELGRRVKGMT